MRTLFAGPSCDDLERVGAHQQIDGESVDRLERCRGRNATNDDPIDFACNGQCRDRIVKPRELTVADRNAQIVALWLGRPPERRGPQEIPEFFQWLSDYTPWLVPAGEQPSDTVTAILRPYMIGG